MSDSPSSAPWPGPDDVRLAASTCVATLMPLTSADWDVAAGDLEWTARQTLEHVVETLMFYARDLATPVTELGDEELRLVCDPRAGIRGLVDGLAQAGAVVAAVVAATPDETRAFHPAGMADRTGFAAMACDEMLVHTGDVVSGLDARFQPPPDLCERVLARLFPAAPREGDPWQRLLWANGRTALPGVPRRGPDWRWQASLPDEHRDVGGAR